MTQAPMMAWHSVREPEEWDGIFELASPRLAERFQATVDMTLKNLIGWDDLPPKSQYLFMLMRDPFVTQVPMTDELGMPVLDMMGAPVMMQREIPLWNPDSTPGEWLAPLWLIDPRRTQAILRRYRELIARYEGKPRENGARV